jgi:predicted outer membrane repeat protein
MRTRSRAIFNLVTLFAMLISLLGSAVAYTPARAVGVLFAKPIATGNGNCMSWANACTLQSALAVAYFGDQIWVQVGTHRPHTSDRTISFNLRNGVAIYGGFTGVETQLSQRNPSTNVTTLSGDLNGDDNGFANNDENSLHVVVSFFTNSPTILDGFVIRGGNANCHSFFDDCFGGGMYNSEASPTLINVIFSNNAASYDGGGMYNNAGSPTLTNVTFSGNSGGYDGGGLHNSGDGANPTLTNVTFSENFASNFGGGIYNSGGTLALTNVIFSDNIASSVGGGMINIGGTLTFMNVTFLHNSAFDTGGGISNRNSALTLTNVTFSRNSSNYNTGGGMDNSGSTLTLTNVTFSENASDYGGGMFNFESTLTLTNVSFSGNFATSGGGMYNLRPGSGGITLINTIIANSPSGGDCVNESVTLSAFSSNNLVEDASNACGLTNDVSGNIVGSDPKLGPLANNGGFTQTHALLAGSSALDNGQDENCPATDQRGLRRPQGIHCDIGSYEFPVFFTIGGNTGVAGVTLRYTDAMPKTVTSQPNGTYSLTIPEGWSGTITPSHTCFTFNPLNRTYNDVTGNQTTQNYSATLNPASGCAQLSVRLGQTTKGPYVITKEGGGRQSYPGADSGPVFVNSTNNVPFIASERVAYYNGTRWTSFSEMMGLPENLKTTKFSFPTYDNIFFDSQLRFANMGTANTTVIVRVNGLEKGRYVLGANQSKRVSYSGLSGGPVVIESSGGVPIIASLRVITRPYNGSFSEIMGLPQSQWSTSYIFPWYNNVELNTQLRVGNVGNSTTTVTVTVRGTTIGSFSLASNASTRLRFAGVNSGPLKVTSSGNVPIVASLRVAFGNENTWTSFSEMMGTPDSQLDNTYVFPWYNNKDIDTQLRLGNVTNSTATVRVLIGGQEMVGSPFTLAGGASIRKSYAGIDKGPVKIVSSQNIVASQRILFKNGSTLIGFSELMGFPASQLATDYLFPWYNNLDLNTQLRLGVP